MKNVRFSNRPFGVKRLRLTTITVSMSLVERLRVIFVSALQAVRPSFVAGFLLAAECATDFGARRSDVHIGNPAIGAARRQEGFSLAQIVGEHRRRQTLRNGIVQLEYCIEVAILDDIEDRREGLAFDRCACRKLNPGILVMQSAQGWATKNVPGAIDGARNRCIFFQG